jgi:hypothetical protein
LNRYSLFLIAAMLLVGSNVGIGKSIVAFVPVPLFALLRFVIAMAVLWPLLRVSKLRRVKAGEWFNLFLQALFGTFGFTLLMLNGVHRTSAVAAGVITSTIPAWSRCSRGSSSRKSPIAAHWRRLRWRSPAWSSSISRTRAPPRAHPVKAPSPAT